MPFVTGIQYLDSAIRKGLLAVDIGSETTKEQLLSRLEIETGQVAQDAQISIAEHHSQLQKFKKLHC